MTAPSGRSLRGQERSRARRARRSGRLGEAFRPQRKLLVGGDGVPLEEFLSRPAEHWIGGRRPYTPQP
jgi:hypothetical protein